MISLKRIWHFFQKKSYALITPLVPIALNMVFFDNLDERIFGRVRGLILLPFIDYHSVPLMGKNSHFLE
jgi:hypothetical protein